MPIRSLADLTAAYDEGRHHSQTYLKNYNAGGQLGTTVPFIDACFMSGYPNLDMRLGDPCVFKPCVAAGNKAVYTPEVPSGQKRYLHTLSICPIQTTFYGTLNGVLFDLVGYYPLIDGDSNEYQVFDNSLDVPRYTDGTGLSLIIVSQITPQAQAGLAKINYVDASGNTRSVTNNISLGNPYAQNLSNYGYIVSGSSDTAVSALSASIAARLPGGVRKILGIQFLTTPSGNYVFYLAKILGGFTTGDNKLFAEKDFFMQNGCRMPEVETGACLNLAINFAGTTAANASLYGQFNFVWG